MAKKGKKKSAKAPDEIAAVPVEPKAAPADPAATEPAAVEGSEAASAATRTTTRQLPETQIDQALAGNDVKRAARLLEQHGERLLLDGDDDRLMAWFEALPDDLVKHSPNLGVLHAWLLLFREQYQSAVGRVRDAERAFRAMEMSADASVRTDGADVVVLTPHQELKQRISAVSTHLSWLRGELAELPDSVDQVMLPASAEHPVWRASALLTLARCRALGGALGEAAGELESAVMCAESSGGGRARRIALDARVELGRVREGQARLDDASAAYDHVIKETAEGQDLSEQRAAALLGRGRVARARGDLAAAREAFDEAFSVAGDPQRFVHGIIEGLLDYASILQAMAQPAEAQQALKRAQEFCSPAHRRYAAPLIGARRVELALARHDRGEAQRWAQQQAFKREHGHGPVAERVQLALAWAQLAAAKHAEALVRADAVLETAGGAERATSACEAQVARAMALSANGSGKQREAADAIRAAVAIAAPAGLVAPFLPAGPGLASLLTAQELAMDDASREFAGKVLAALGASGLVSDEAPAAASVPAPEEARPAASEAAPETADDQAPAKSAGGAESVGT